MCYSPASSIISVSTNRSANIKESKEKRNREKLLAGPGSEFSLANPEDMEIDYYDYNVINASAAPGSYLGMDPAYLVWIPPLDNGTMTIDEQEFDESDTSDSETADNSMGNETEPHYEEISPRYAHTTKGRNDGCEKTLDATKFSNENNKNVELTKVLAANAFNEINDGESPKEHLHRKSSTSSAIITTNLILKNSKAAVVDAIQMTEFKPKKANSSQRYADSPVKVHKPHAYHQSRQQSEQRYSYASDDKDNDTEKETAVVKSPSDNVNEYYELDDIQFADDDDEVDGSTVSCAHNSLAAM